MPHLTTTAPPHASGAYKVQVQVQTSTVRVRLPTQRHSRDGPFRVCLFSESGAGAGGIFAPATAINNSAEPESQQRMMK